MTALSAAESAPSPAPSPPLLAALVRQARAAGVAVPHPLLERVAIDLPADAQIQAVGQLIGGPNGRPALLVLTQWHVVVGPLPESILSALPQHRLRRGSLLVVGREALAEAQAGESELSLVISTTTTSEARRATHFVRLPMVAATANVAPTLDWVVANSPARTPRTPPVGTPVWAADPLGAARLRWWDGSTWTGHTRF